MDKKETKKGCCSNCYTRYEGILESAFQRIGSFVGNYPVYILCSCIFINLALILGFLRFESENDVEVLYTPHNSQSFKDRSFLRTVYRDPTEEHFQPYQLPDFGKYAEVIIMSKNMTKINSKLFFDEMREIDKFIQQSVLVADNGSWKNFDDLCAVQREQCALLGSVILTQQFEKDFLLNNVSYPWYNGTLLSPVLASVESEDGWLRSTKGAKLRYYLLTNTTLSSQWEISFLSKIRDLKTNQTEISYSTSESLGRELEKNTDGDIQFFSLTFTLMLTYASFASASSFVSCNNVGNRLMLGFAGVLTPILAIGSSIGFVSAVGVKFTSIVGVMPFLVVGIGIDDMFLLMSGMADAPPLTTASIIDRMKYTLRKSGIAITITSITDLLAFTIGATSMFISIKTFCIYTGVAIFFCYLNQLFFFCPAMCLNERRTQQERHFLCCFKINEDKDISKARIYKHFCSGSIPKTREDVESALEKYPKRIITQYILIPVIGKIFICVLFLTYLGFSIYGAIHLKQGLSLYNLVSEDSYFHKHSLWDEQFFKSEPVIALTVKGQYSYALNITQNTINSILSQAKNDKDIDKTFEINWLNSFNSSPFFKSSSEMNFVSSLKNFVEHFPQFDNDIVFHENASRIQSSRFYIKSKDLKSTNAQGALMLRLRKISENANLSLFFYTPAFIFYEQYVQIWPSTWQTVGAALGVMIIITIIFMPNPLMVFVILTLVSILLGIFGFMYYWGLTLSSITMIHLVMSVGFSVDFSVHICHAFLSVRSEARQKSLPKAFDIVGGPVLNAAFSSLLGIAVLGFTKSYIFQSFGKVMFLVIGFGLFHAAFVLPLVLWIFFPCYSTTKSENLEFDTLSNIHDKINISVLHKSRVNDEISRTLNFCQMSKASEQNATIVRSLAVGITYPIEDNMCYSRKKIEVFKTADNGAFCWDFEI